MTRAEFDGGWEMLLGVWPKAEQSAAVYFGVLGGLPATTWLEAVRSAVTESAFFPTPSHLLEAAYAAERRSAEEYSARQLPAPDEKPGHPDCPMLRGEKPLAYAARLAAFLGYEKSEARK